MPLAGFHDGGITSWQQQVPVAQPCVGANARQFPVTPEMADSPISAKTGLFRGAIAIAANGIPVFNALNNRGGDASLAGELDEFGGHCGRGDGYHYPQRGMLEQNGALDRATSRVGSESVRLHRLSNSMLDLVRDGEASPHARFEVDVGLAVRAVVDDLRAAYPHRRIDTHIDPASGAMVLGDPARIHQAILNLGVNACTHSPPAPPSPLPWRRRHGHS